MLIPWRSSKRQRRGTLRSLRHLTSSTEPSPQRDSGRASAVGAPILVGEPAGGSINTASANDERFAPDVEERLAHFTERSTVAATRG
ncbi:MAG TPA: hypothetical protein VN886_13760 [Acidimicrobiales bacterium]|nr:hypothetical protein [Acidimicrobiales bacterium]